MMTCFILCFYHTLYFASPHPSFPNYNPICISFFWGGLWSVLRSAVQINRVTLCLRTALFSYKFAKWFTRLCQSSYSDMLEAVICRGFKYLSAEPNLGSSENQWQIASVPTLIKFTSHFHAIEVCLFGTSHPRLAAQSQGAQGPTRLWL